MSPRMSAALRDYARDRLAGLNWLNVQGNSAGKGAIFSFTLDGPAHAHDISTILDKRGIAVRAGTHCAMPLMAHWASPPPAAPRSGCTTRSRRSTRWSSALELPRDLFG
jgi:cysteine desulfurase/selenocysteine lyase